jgi:hypothetical protein
MSRRSLDIIIAAGGALFAILIVALGFMLKSEADFAKSTVTQQLSEQKIVFKEEAALTPSERALPGLVTYAGQPLTTGVQAEAYAGMIGLHVQEQATKAGYPGETYGSIGAVQTALRTQVADLKAKNDPGAADAQKQLDAVTALRESQFKGEMLKGMLLTSYGFSIFGEKAMLAATVLFGIAAVAAILSAAGFVHALVTPKEQPVFTGTFAPAPGATAR